MLFLISFLVPIQVILYAHFQTFKGYKNEAVAAQEDTPLSDKRRNSLVCGSLYTFEEQELDSSHQTEAQKDENLRRGAETLFTPHASG